MTDVEQLALSLWIDDAVVLFDWLMSTDLNTVPITHPAEKQALADLLNQLEQTLPFSPTQQDIDAARARVAKDMGW